MNDNIMQTLSFFYKMKCDLKGHGRSNKAILAKFLQAYSYLIGNIKPFYF